MFKLITKDGPARHSRWNLLVCSDPDELARLARRHVDGGAADRDAFADAFSRAVSGIRIGRTWKFTHRGRLDHSTRRLAEVLGSLGLPPPAGIGEDKSSSPLRLLDVGASDGITTLDAVALLRERLGCQVRAVLLEKFTSIIRLRRAGLCEYRTRDGSPFMLRLGCVVLRLNDSTPVQALARKAYAACARFRQDDPRCEAISLINPLVAADPAIEVIDGDVLVPQPQLGGQFEIARAANVLTQATFTPAEITLAIACLHDYLADGGILLISRNPHEADPQTERGSLWQKRGGRFNLLEHFGGGAEIAPLVDQFAGQKVSPASRAEFAPAAAEPGRQECLRRETA